MQEQIQADTAAMSRRMAFDRAEDTAGAGAGADEDASMTPSGQAINQLFAPPDYNEADTYYQVVEKAKADGKCILVNIQQAEVFASHTLNRDVWSDDTIKDIIAGNFKFWQRDDKSKEGEQFCQYYQCGHQLPHICVIDPRTGRRVKAWDGRKWVEPTAAADYLFRFLDEFSMSRSPPALSPEGSPSMKPQAEPDVQLPTTGDMKLVGLEEAAEAAAEAACTATAADTSMEPPKEMPCTMPDEPPEGVDAIKVSFRLPSGQRTTKRFLQTDAVEKMFVVASALAQQPLSLIDLATQYPKRSLRDVEGGLTASVKAAEVANNMVLVSVRAA